MSKTKLFFSTILLLVIVLVSYYFSLIQYGISQGLGQLEIVWNAQPVESILKDPTFPDSLKNKIVLVQEIRQYAFDSLGLKKSPNYTTVYNQKGKPILWVVTACEPFALKAKEWKFPLLGSFSYKGFFKYEKALKEASLLKKEGFDVSIDEVGGWSTLGWFKDPILTNMLQRSEGNLANLIIHELTHGTLYVKDNVDFNENLASFVGDKGAAKFLSFKYGKLSKEFINYEKSRINSKKYTQLVLSYSRSLDSLYNHFNSKTTYHEKLLAKQQFFKKFKVALLSFLNNSDSKVSKKKANIENLNNTYFMDIKRYREDLEVFDKEFKDKFNSDFNKYMQYLKNKYPSM